MLENEKAIDNALLIYDDGKAYLVFDRFNADLNVWIAWLEEAFQTIRPGTMISAFTSLSHGNKYGQGSMKTPSFYYI